jgi:NADH dehydrogenase/NADH:ubiquinone oxidoreductase subunit G
VDQETIRKIAQELNHYLPYYSSLIWVQALVALVAAGIGAIAGSYLNERGKNLATKHDFEQLQQQLNEQTHALESIKDAIGNRSVLRAKLEELLSRVDNCNYHLEQWRNTVSEKEGRTERDPGPALYALTTLYFPELRREVNAYLLLYRQMRLLTQKSRLKFYEHKEKEHARLIQEFNEDYGNYHTESLEAAEKINQSARDLMIALMKR